MQFCVYQEDVGVWKASVKIRTKEGEEEEEFLGTYHTTGGAMEAAQQCIAANYSPPQKLKWMGAWTRQAGPRAHARCDQVLPVERRILAKVCILRLRAEAAEAYAGMGYKRLCERMKNRERRRVRHKELKIRKLEKEKRELREQLREAEQQIERWTQAAAAEEEEKQAVVVATAAAMRLQKWWRKKMLDLGLREETMEECIARGGSGMGWYLSQWSSDEERRRSRY